MKNVFTPLRYPGGKTKLYNFVSGIIKSNALEGCTYVEPFAGGAGLAVKLLLNGIVSKVVLNDIDYAIYSIWDSILNSTDELCEFIDNVPLNVTEWQRRRAIYANQRGYTQLEIGLSAFYLNRTNVSGVLTGGIIGGFSQEGNYKIDARFNRSNLIDRVRAIAKYKEHIHLYNWNASDLISDILPGFDNCFVYFDPPYVHKGSWLYRNAFTKDDHRHLSEVVTACPFKWIVTYDRCDYIKELYSGFEYQTLSINYSAGQTKSGDEIVIFSPGVNKGIRETASELA